jgi:AAA domain
MGVRASRQREGSRMTDPVGGFGTFGGGKGQQQQSPGSQRGKPNGPDTDGDVQMVQGTIRPITAIPPRQWAYGKFLLFGSAACIGGMDGAGKGMLATAMALAMITGFPLLGEKVWRSGPVAIITYEDDQEEWERRIAAACLHFSENGYQLDYETLIGSFYFLQKPGGRVTLAERTRDGGLFFPDTARIVHFLKEISAVKLIIDPFNSAHALEDGNNNVAVAAVAQEITSIAQQAHVAALLLHHLRKGAQGNIDDLMGAVALRANFRSVRILQVADEGAALGLGIPIAEAWRYLWVAGSKENYAPPLDQRMWFHKPSVKLNNPADIYTFGDEVGVIERWEPPAAFEGMDYASLRDVFAAIAANPHSPDKRAKAIDWAGQPLMEIGGRNPTQATKILNLWLESKTLIPGKPFKTDQRREIKTITTDPAKVTAILAQHTPPGKPQETAG